MGARLRTVLAAMVATAAGAMAAVALSATTTSPSTTLSANGTLTAGQGITSADGHFVLTMGSNGNLLERIAGGRGVWSTGTATYPGAHAMMQVNGNLVIYDSAGSAVWSSNSPAGAGCPRLVLQDDGNLVIYTTSAIWSAASRVNILRPGDVLQAGWSLYSIGPEDYRLTMLSDGNLALFDAARDELWSTKTYHHPGAYASMQTDGNLVVYAPGGQALWSSATNGHAGAYLEMLGDGNADIIGGSSVLWRTGTYHTGSGGSIAPTAPPPVACPAPVPPTPPTTSTTVQTVTTVVTTPVATPLPQPPRRPRVLRIRLAVKWTWNRATTRVNRTQIGSFPGRTRITLKWCRGRHCAHHHTVSARGPGGLRRLLHGLVGHRYRAGDVLYLTLHAPGYRDEKAKITIRWSRKPAIQLLRS